MFCQPTSYLRCCCRSCYTRDRSEWSTDLSIILPTLFKFYFTILSCYLFFVYFFLLWITFGHRSSVFAYSLIILRTSFWCETGFYIESVLSNTYLDISLLNLHYELLIIFTITYTNINSEWLSSVTIWLTISYARIR